MKTESTSQTAPKPSWKYAILLTIAALALSASPGSRGDADCGADFFWINPGTGDWFEPSNWTDINGNHFVPACHYPAYINNGGTAQINSPFQTARACETFLGQSFGQSGNLTVDHGSLVTCNNLHVGYGGTGALKITNGGSVTTTFIADIAAQLGSNGTARVDGTGSLWTVTNGPDELDVGGIVNGSGGTGLLSVTNNAQVSAGIVHVYKSGTLTGNGTVTATSGTTIEGTLTPSNGTLTIVGDLAFSGSAATMECNVVPTAADHVTVTGQATLTGARI